MTSDRSNVNIVRPETGTVIHRAGWVLLSSRQVLENGYITVENGRVTGVSTGKPPEAQDRPVVDHGSGVLMPGLINAHIHLELSALLNRLPFGKGFSAWVRKLLEERDAMDHDVLLEAASKSLEIMNLDGVIAAGEVSTLGLTKELFDCSRVNGVWFQERLGPYIKESETSGATGKRSWVSLAGHAPHTTAPDLIQAMKQQTVDLNLPFSIHVGESEEEIDFITRGKGAWADFLKERGIDFSDWPVPEKSPVAYLNRLGVLDPLTLCIHLLRADAHDLDLLADSGAGVVVCPRSNENLHGRLPDLETFLARGLEPALGTDSLASCDSLSIFDEMAFVRTRYPRISPPEILAMATEYGARVLGMEACSGTIGPGKAAEFLYLPIRAKNLDQLIDLITGYHDR